MLGVTFPLLVQAKGDLSQQPGFVKGEFIYEKAPFPQCHAATIEESSDGLVAAWFGGEYEKHPEVGIWVSRLVDGKWTPPVEVANGVQYETPEGEKVRYATWNPVLFQSKEGPLFLFYKVGESPRTWWGMVTASTDGGKTWSQPQRLPEGILGPIKNRPMELPDGSLLCPTSDELDQKPKIWKVYFEKFDPKSGRWTRIGPVEGFEEIPAIQPSILSHGEKTLQAIGRTNKGKIFETWSHDQGNTWEKLTFLELPNPNSGTDAITLQDGRHLLVYNHSPMVPGKWKGRSPLNLAVSEDGKNWKAALVLENQEGEYSYPSLIQSKDGLVHIVYTWKRERVKHVVLDPAKLVPREMQNGAWPNEDEKTAD